MPVLDRQSLEFISRGVEQTRRVGMRLGALLQPSDLICLVGELGAGPTTLVQGITAGWGSLDPATSPSFVLVNVYRQLVGNKLFHLDAYRLNSAAEAEDLDIDALLGAGPLVIEWADRIQQALPIECLWVTMQWVDDNQRDMVFTAHGSRYLSLLSELRMHIYGVS